MFGHFSEVILVLGKSRCQAESLVENLVRKIKSSIQFGGKCLIGRYIDDIIPTRSDAKRIEELRELPAF